MRQSPRTRVILTALCGHGHLDPAAYGSYLAGEMVDRPLDESAIEAAMQALPPVAV